MMANINPRIDLVFKKIFGVEENKDLLIALINSIVSSEDQVADIVLLNPYTIQNFADEKSSILDIKAKGLDGTYFNIEIQITDEGDYDKRALYYWAKLYTEQLKKGDAYQSLCKVIGIHILNFFSIPETQSYANRFHITQAETGIQYFKNLELYTIELKKFEGLESKVLSELVSNIKTALDTWVAFLTRHELFNPKDLPSTIPQKKQLAKALTVLEVMNFNAHERDTYEAKLKWLRAEASALNKLEKRVREEGREEGREQGREQGKKEQATSTAKYLLAVGIDRHLIAESTGLTLEEINRLVG